jgi:hypothetical protein
MFASHGELVEMKEEADNELDAIKNNFSEKFQRFQLELTLMCFM